MTDNHTPLQLPTRDAIARMVPFVGLGLKNIHLITTREEAASALKHLLEESFLGFDTESRPTFRIGQHSEGPHVLQFATLHRAYLFQAHLPFCVPAVAEIIRARQVVKIGFGMSDDIKRIKAKFRVHPRSVIDMDHIFKSLGHNNSIGTRTAIALLFGKRFIKSHKTTTSNWSNRRLSEKQLLYAANDAFAALAVFMALKRRGILYEAD
jgi:ribonuclease D